MSVQATWLTLRLISPYNPLSGDLPYTKHDKGRQAIIGQRMKEVKKNADPGELGMILVHRGIVRAISKHGRPVRGMRLSCNKEELEEAVEEHKKRDGIEDIRVWINSGDLHVGDKIMHVLVAGRFRTDVLPVFESLLSIIKKKIVTEQELA